GRAADAGEERCVGGGQSIVVNEVRTVIAIPLRPRRAAGAEPSAPSAEGVLYLDSRSVLRNLTSVSHDVLRALAGECAALLESAPLVEAEPAAQQDHHEVGNAASFQPSFTSL